MDVRKLFAECLGTALLVYFAVGVATLSFGAWFMGSVGTAGSSNAAGVVATSLAFGLVLLALVYTLGPVSGCHVNPAVTIGFLVARRISITEAAGYWVAQFAGGLLGAGALFLTFKQSPLYGRKTTGLGTDGWDKASMVHLHLGGAFLAEVVLTFLFVLVVLTVTSRIGNSFTAGVAIGLALTTVHLVGIPLTGTSVNPARSLGPAVIVGGDAIRQVWLFIVAPLVGGVIAAGVHLFLVAEHGGEAATTAPAAEAAAG